MFKKLSSVITALLLALALSFSMMSSATLADFTPTTDESYLHYMTFNLRCDTTSQEAMSETVRGPHLLSLIEGYDVDSVGFQEASDTWMGYLRTAMADIGYSYVGVGRDTGTDDDTRSGQTNEYSPIFYKTDKYDLLESDTFWLSETPDEVSGPAWNAGYTRICTYAVLQNKETGEIYIHFNTHQDHMSDLAKENGAKLMISRIDEISAKYNNAPVVFTGDFNMSQYDTDEADGLSVPYKIITSRMDNSHDLATNIVVEGSSWSGFQDPIAWEEGLSSDKDKPDVDTTTSPIDFIFLSKGQFSVSTYTIVDDTFTFELNGTTYDNNPVSDHYGVYCEAKIENNSLHSYDDSELIATSANEYLNGETPASQVTDLLTGIDNLAETATITSNLTCDSAYPAANLADETNLVKVDSTAYTGNVFWELTAELKNTAKISALTLDTGSDADLSPDRIQIMGSSDGTTWTQIGSTITSDITGSKAYIILNELTTVKYIKLVMPNAASDAVFNNLSIYGFETAGNEKLDNATEVTPISGPERTGNNENFQKAFDSDTSTKFYSKLELYTDNCTDPIIWEVNDGAIAATAYSFTTANDTAANPYRNPYNWVLYGSTDYDSSTGEGTWTVIDEKSDYTTMTTANYTEAVFDISDPQAYQYYKLDIDYTKQTTEEDTHRVQLSEISLYQSNSVVETPDSELYALNYVNYTGEPLSVDYGTSADQLALGSSAYVLLNSGVETACAISWDLTSYDPNQSGEQTITGTVVLSDSKMSNPDNLTVSATITVGDAPETDPTPAYKTGDVTEDGDVTVADVVKLRDLIMSGSYSDVQLLAGDLDGSGTLTVSDVVALRDYIMKGDFSSDIK